MLVFSKFIILPKAKSSFSFLTRGCVILTWPWTLIPAYQITSLSCTHGKPSTRGLTLLYLITRLRSRTDRIIRCLNLPSHHNWLSLLFIESWSVVLPRAWNFHFNFRINRVAKWEFRTSILNISIVGTWRWDVWICREDSFSLSSTNREFGPLVQIRWNVILAWSWDIVGLTRSIFRMHCESLPLLPNSLRHLVCPGPGITFPRNSWLNSALSSSRSLERVRVSIKIKVVSVHIVHPRPWWKRFLLSLSTSSHHRRAFLFVVRQFETDLMSSGPWHIRRVVFELSMRHDAFWSLAHSSGDLVLSWAWVLFHFGLSSHASSKTKSLTIVHNEFEIGAIGWRVWCLFGNSLFITFSHWVWNTVWTWNWPIFAWAWVIIRLGGQRSTFERDSFSRILFKISKVSICTWAWILVNFFFKPGMTKCEPTSLFLFRNIVIFAWPGDKIWLSRRRIDQFLLMTKARFLPSFWRRDVSVGSGPRNSIFLRRSIPLTNMPALVRQRAFLVIQLLS